MQEPKTIKKNHNGAAYLVLKGLCIGEAHCLPQTNISHRSASKEVINWYCKYPQPGELIRKVKQEFKSGIKPTKLVQMSTRLSNLIHWSIAETEIRH